MGREGRTEKKKGNLSGSRRRGRGRPDSRPFILPASRDKLLAEEDRPHKSPALTFTHTHTPTGAHTLAYFCIFLTLDFPEFLDFPSGDLVKQPKANPEAAGSEWTSAQPAPAEWAGPEDASMSDGPGTCRFPLSSEADSGCSFACHRRPRPPAAWRSAALSVTHGEPPPRLWSVECQFLVTQPRPRH